MSLVQWMGGVFVLASIAGAVGIGVVPLWRARAASSWVETRCHIQRSEVEAAGDSYRAVVAYTYGLGDSQMSGDRVDFALHGTSSHRSFVDDQVRPYPAGGDVPCWYDRDNPAAVVLSRLAPATFFLLLPLLFGVVGFIALRIGARGSHDDMHGTRGSDGRHIYVRRGTSWIAVVAVAAMWLVSIAAALPATVASDSTGELGIFICTAFVTLAFLHEWRCLRSVVTVIIPPRLRREEPGRAEWSARSPLVSPRATASLIAVATTSGARVGKLSASYEVETETVLTIPVEEDAARSGSGTLWVPAASPTSTRERGRHIDWFLEVHVHLPLGPDITVRAPIEVSSD